MIDVRAIFVSDVHLGIRACKAERLVDFLRGYSARELFLIGDIVDFQALALGVPIVSTAVMGTATVLKGARSARTSAEDVGAFAGHVAALLRSPAQRMRLAEAGPADARTWSAPALMTRVTTLYARLAGSRATELGDVPVA